MKKVLIIDDDPLVYKLFTHIFENKFNMSFEMSGFKALELLKTYDFDFCVIDLKLIETDGFKILEQIKHENLNPKCRFFILTASDSLDDQIRGQELGIDEYIRKPIAPRLIQAVFKKYSEKPKIFQSHELTYKSLSVNSGQMKVFLEQEEIKELTNSEYRILLLLLKNLGQIFSREDIYRNISRKPSTNVDRTIDMHVSSLRKKLKFAGEWIKTKRGQGYYFSESEKS
ncbi:MAG: response regulator transcription factor [Bacteriovoracaceae bacterium]|nr:response regulator transcription factor [Bacteriovoracaceae bacterium]